MQKDMEMMFRGKRVHYEHHWLDRDTFVFQFGDGELADTAGDGYFIHLEYHCGDGTWVVTVYWEDDSSALPFMDSDGYITGQEAEAVKGFIQCLPDTGLERCGYKMDAEEAIKMLEYDMAMILFDPSAGETITLDQVRMGNEDNYKCYLADEFAIKAIEELGKYQELGTVEYCARHINLAKTAYGKARS